uniref:Uncharacterized protein n=1 Tax=Panagrolaimus sp. ES5 TaxID=591445 RepID=A0AC34GBE0_9BILA
MSTLKRAIKKKKVHENLPIVAASSSAYSFRERPMQNDVSSFSLRKLQNHETSLHSKTHVTSTTDLGRTVSATSSSTLNSRNGDTGNKKRGRPAAATISSSYSFRQRPKGNVTAKSKKNDSSNQERDTVSESGMDDMHQLQNNNVSESGMDGESEPLEKDKLEMGDAFDQMGDIYMPEENDVIQVLNVNVSPSEKDTAFVPNDNVFQQEMEGIPEVMEEDVAVSSNNCVPGPMEEIFLPEEKDVSQGLNDNVSQPEKDTVS